MFTVEDFARMIENSMPFATADFKRDENGLESVHVYYEDYKASTFHNYIATVKGEIVHLYILADGQDVPIDVLMPENLKHAYDVMKAHDDLMWSIKDSIEIGDLL